MSNLTRAKSFEFHARARVALFAGVILMEHSSHLHPEFGLLSPTRRLRRELRTGVSSLLFGGIAGAICVSSVVAFRHSDRSAIEIAEVPHATEGELDRGLNVDTRAASSESHAGTAARLQPSPEVSVQRSRDTSAPAVAPESDVAPKPRVVRIRHAIDNPAIARLPLGRSEAPASPPADVPESTQASSAPRDNTEVPAVAPEKAGVRSSPREASLIPKKKVQKTARDASPPRDDARDSFRHDTRRDEWRARPDVNGGRRLADRAWAREARSSFPGFWDWSR
jgi:hypothetical protein